MNFLRLSKSNLELKVQELSNELSPHVIIWNLLV
jgi:hypothetical protein